VYVLLACALADEPVDPTAASLLAAHNKDRKEAGRGPLSFSTKLGASAAAHARDMAEHGTLDHKGSDGSTVAARVKRAGYVYVRVGENIADGQETVEEVMRSWMKSPAHRENILADFTELGAARADDDQGNPYWCVNFGVPMPRLKPDQAAAAVVKQINRDRQAAKQPTLKLESALGRAAMAIAAKMAARDNLDIPVDPFNLIDGKAVQGRDLRIQLSANVPTPDEAAKELLGEDPKRLAAFRLIGVGYDVAKSGTPYWCAIFAKHAANARPGIPKPNDP
jgi:uncharacterized protein YkwD